jgi:hypothetical protein
LGGLAGLGRDWRRQAAEVCGCVVALALAWWQRFQFSAYVCALWPVIEDTRSARIVAAAYLFAALYGLWRVLISLYTSGLEPRTGRWTAGLLGALQAGALAWLAIVLPPRA